MTRYGTPGKALAAHAAANRLTARRDAATIGNLLGTRMVLNEFVAY